MVALLPDAATAAALAVPGGESPAKLHLTLCYLGDDVTGWAPAQRGLVLERAIEVSRWHGPIDARAFATATFNPDGHADREPCGVYLIGDSETIPDIQRAVESLARALQHPGFVPHVTGKYGGSASDLSYTGPVRFDRVAAVLADEWHEFPLTGQPDQQISREQLAAMTPEKINEARMAGRLQLLLGG